jgi:integrase
MLALVPLRLHTLTVLRIGEQLARNGGLWVLDIPANDIKTRRPLEFPVSQELSKRIDRYLKLYRSQIFGADTHNALWASDRGRPMSDSGMYKVVCERTKRAFGFSVNPHRFRHAAASFWSIRDPVNVRGVKDLLGHASFGMTEKHYIMAQSRVAGRALAGAIDSLRKGLGRS